MTGERKLRQQYIIRALLSLNKIIIRHQVYSMAQNHVLQLTSTLRHLYIPNFHNMAMLLTEPMLPKQGLQKAEGRELNGRSIETIRNQSTLSKSVVQRLGIPSMGVRNWNSLANIP